MSRQTVTHLPVEALKSHPGNIRDDLGDLTDLAASIREHGILQPITVTESGEAKRPWLLLAGHRRLGAAQLAGLVSVPVVIRHGVSDSAEQIVLMLVENCQRRDLGPVEKAEAYGYLRNQGLTQANIARRVGLRPSTVNYYLTLLELDDDSRQQVRDGSIASTQAVEAVRTARRVQRQDSAQPERGRPVFTEPAHLTKKHPLAEHVLDLCTHTTRPRPHGDAGAGCGQCWETVIRAHALGELVLPEVTEVEDAGSAVDQVVVDRFLTSPTRTHADAASKAEKDAIADAWRAAGRSGRELSQITGWKEGRYGTNREDLAS